MFATLQNKSYRKKIFMLFIVSFLVRAIVFQFYVKHHERYRQPDSIDYHNCAIGLAVGSGMHRPDTKKPIFWRTPGYPFFLSFFYELYGVKSGGFSNNQSAQHAAIWTQLTISSLTPLFIFYLINMLTGISSIAWLIAWIFVFHIGTVLASTFLLTEALALCFFFPFLFFFYKSFHIRGAKGKNQNNTWIASIIMSALFLGITTWIRPMGEFVAVVSIFILALLGDCNIRTKIKKITLFLFIFFLVTSPWYLRNYNLTGKTFFCPMFGPYLNSFSAPKIIRNTRGFSLEKSIHMLYTLSEKQAKIDEIIALNNGKLGCKHHAALKIAIPIIWEHPFLFFKDWLKEILKTSFDLHSYQLVSFAKNSFMYDPLEEFLTEKWQECLYKQQMPFTMRLLVFLELILELFKWFGLFMGIWLFILKPIIKRGKVSYEIKNMGHLWLKIIPIIGSIIFMTGGFGYARLRLPVDPLMIMLSLTYWYWLFNKKRTHEKIIRVVAQ